jgi:hypothetical protein
MIILSFALSCLEDYSLSANASFDNAYKGGVTIDTNGGTTVTCEVGSWGNSGGWDNTPIVNNGSISAKVNSPQDKTEQMIGLSYKTSEAKAQNMSYNLIDYAWYFRFTDRTINFC